MRMLIQDINIRSSSATREFTQPIRIPSIFWEGGGRVIQLEATVGNEHASENAKIARFPQMLRFSLCGLSMLIAASGTLGAQESPKAGAEDKRILWIFTNHRTTDDEADLT